MPRRGRQPGSTKRRALFAVLVGLGFASCVADTVVQVGTDDVVELRITPTASTLGIGRTLQLRAYPLDASGALIAGQQVLWSSRATAIATVDTAGVVTGVAEGDAEIVASFAGLEAVATVTVARAAAIVLSDDSVAFATTAGGADPAPDSIDVTNGGDFDLVGLAVDSIVYGSGASDWLTTQLDASTAPTTLVLSAQIAGVTAAGTYAATAWLSGFEADDSPAPIVATLTIGAGAAATIAVQAGDGQTAAAGAAVPVAPSVLVTDQFDNPVPGADVVFAVTGGGGSVTGATATTDAAGVAAVGSWTLGTTAGANSLTATNLAAGSVAFTATGVPGQATKIDVAGGNNQSAVAGSQVSTPPSAVARDQFDNGVAGVAVTFQVASGGGSVTGATQTTGADGVAQVGSWTLGPIAGQNSLVAFSATVPADSATFTATGLSGQAAALQYVAGTAQTDTVAATLPTAYAVRVVDNNGNGVPGIPVTWSVTGGGGSIPQTSTTDANGVATATRVLGTLVGTHTATGAVGGLAGSPVAFSATATVGAPAVVVRVAGNAQSATVNTAVAVDPQVRVEDRHTNPISGHSVTFQVTGGGGAISPTGAITTGAGGTATLNSWTLGTAAGTNNNTLTATAAGVGLTGNPASFTATATAGSPTAIIVNSGNGQTAITGVNVANPPTARVNDQFGNPVSSVTVNFAASGTGSVGSASAVTNASGLASTTWTVRAGGATMSSTGTFPNTLTATIQGTVTNTTFSGSAIYSYVTHVNPLWSPEGCTGCHGGISGLTLSGTAAANYAELVNVIPVCDNSLGTSYRVVNPDGGTAASETFSILMRFIDPALPLIGGCDSTSNMVMSDSARTIIRAWIRNGAPNN